MSDSDSEVELVRTTSDKGYKVAPNDEEFKIKIKPRDQKTVGILYQLKKGQTLPYAPNLHGYQITFGQDLKPDLGPGWSSDMSKGCWVFREKEDPLSEFSPGLSDTTPRFQSSQDQSDTSPNQLSQTPSSCTSQQTRTPRSLIQSLDAISEDNVDLNIDEQGESSEKSEDDLIMEFFEEADNDSVPQYKCTVCGYECDWRLSSVQHMRSKHPQWRNMTPNMSPVPPSPASVLSGLNVQSPSGSTIHTNPQWIDTFKREFKELIVSKCSQDTREVFENNADLKDVRSKKLVRGELTSSVVDYLLGVWGGVGVPKLAVMREVATTMAIKYPNMFEDKGDTGETMGYGLGGNLGNKNLDKHLVERFKARVNKRKTNQEEVGDMAEETPKKRGKRKEIYGVDNRKWHQGKADKDAVEAIKKTSQEPSFDKREEAYSKHREALQHQIKTSNKDIQKVCRGFYTDAGHLAKHFEWLTNVPSLVTTVEANLFKQLDLMMRYLHHVELSVPFKERFARIEDDVEMEYGGSRTFRDIHILRETGSNLDKDGSSLLKLQKEIPAQSASPFILACEVDKNWVFEVWVEEQKLLGNLSLAYAIASYLHLVFVFDLKYSKESQTLADILQRRIAKYGADEGIGTRTNTGKSTAKTKITKYLQVLGEILSDD